MKYIIEIIYLNTERENVNTKCEQIAVDLREAITIITMNNPHYGKFKIIYVKVFPL